MRTGYTSPSLWLGSMSGTGPCACLPTKSTLAILSASSRAESRDEAGRDAMDLKQCWTITYLIHPNASKTKCNAMSQREILSAQNMWIQPRKSQETIAAAIPSANVHLNHNSRLGENTTKTMGLPIKNMLVKIRWVVG